MSIGDLRTYLSIMSKEDLLQYADEEKISINKSDSITNIRKSIVRDYASKIPATKAGVMSRLTHYGVDYDKNASKGDLQNLLIRHVDSIPDIKEHQEFHNYSEDFEQVKLKFINYQLSHNIKVPENSLVNKFIDKVNSVIRPLVLSNSSKYKYVGPSTDLFNNMSNNVLPYNKLDALALEHDIEYLEIGLLKNKEKLTKKDKNEIIRLQSIADDKMTRGIDLLMREQNPGPNDPTHDELLKVKRLLQTKQGFGLDFVGTTEPLTENDKQYLTREKEQLESKKRPLERAGVQTQLEEEKDASASGFPKGGLVSEYSEDDVKMAESESDSESDADESNRANAQGEPMKTVPINISTNNSPKMKDIDEILNELKLGIDKEDLTQVELTDIYNKYYQNINKKESTNLNNFANKTPSLKVGDQVITGDRGMRADIAGSIPGSYVKLNKDEKARNIAFYSSLNFVKTGFGNGNQQILPFSYDGWASKNKLFDAVKYNEHLQYSGRLNLGDQYIRKDKKPTLNTLHQYELILTPTIQLNQKPEAYVTQRKVGEPIQMASEPHSFGMYQRRYAKECRLFNPNVVNGQRL